MPDGPTAESALFSEPNRRCEASFCGFVPMHVEWQTVASGAAAMGRILIRVTLL
jgi:hypothetical protein